MPPSTQQTGRRHYVFGLSVRLRECTCILRPACCRFLVSCGGLARGWYSQRYSQKATKTMWPSLLLLHAFNYYTEQNGNFTMKPERSHLFSDVAELNRIWCERGAMQCVWKWCEAEDVAAAAAAAAAFSVIATQRAVHTFVRLHVICARPAAAHQMNIMSHNTTEVSFTNAFRNWTTAESGNSFFAYELSTHTVNWRHRIYGHDTIAILWV